ncbi:MAG TPA: hypothetical protein VJO53_14660 [Candidatus Acidoferrales bacterium]|nr:hypothetical protein [Candidatus Acidoferrales bacterium]
MPATTASVPATRVSRAPHSATRSPGDQSRDRDPSTENGDARARRTQPPRPLRPPTDDEILGLASSPPESREACSEADAEAGPADEAAGATSRNSDLARAAAENLGPILDANPDLRRAWEDAQSYRETFSSPEEARGAGALLADLDRMDALFFSRRPEDHAELAHAVARLDPEAFASLAQAMAQLAPAVAASRIAAANADPRSAGFQPAFFSESAPAPNRQHDAGATNLSPANAVIPSAGPASYPAPVSGAVSPKFEGSASGFRGADSRSAGFQPAFFSESAPAPNRQHEPGAAQPPEVTHAQSAFFHATNAAAVQGVLDAIESQVERLLPEGVSKSARNRVVGEIYRELDTSLGSNRQLAQQIRDAFRSGALDADHQRALVSLVTGRARQALPGVAKRVLSEWTSTIVAANQDRRTRQRAAERRVDIAGSGRAGNDAPRPIAPRDLDYARMSDSDILNL